LADADQTVDHLGNGLAGPQIVSADQYQGRGNGQQASQHEQSVHSVEGQPAEHKVNPNPGEPSRKA
jgi:hypothetical protein